MNSLTRGATFFAWTGLALLAAASGVAQTMPPRLEAGLPGPSLRRATNWWSTDVSAAPVDGQSDAFIAYIDNGGARPLHPDFGGTLADGVSIYGFPYAVVDGSQPKKAVQFDQPDESDGVDHSTQTSYPFYPIPDAAITLPHWIEGGDPGSIDDTGAIDRHLLIVDRDNRLLYELYNVWWDGSQWTAYSGAFWDLKTDDRRPDGWTSADAAGLDILPGLVRHDEVYGPDEIRHGFRFTVRHTNGYVYPASHLAGPQTAGAPPMGMRLRLKASKDITGFDPAIQKIFRAMKKYGLIVGDNGTDMYVSGTWDDRWDNDVLNPAFGALTADDFEVIERGWEPPLATALAVDAHPGGSSNQDGILEPGETATVEPSWENPPSGSASLAGAASSFAGPPGASYAIADGAAAYGAPAFGAPASCFDAGADCFALAVSSPSPRPALHWDAVFTETVNGTAAKTWTLHVGASFADVPSNDPFYAKIETLFHDGVTAGCSGVNYCPGDPVTRAQMAVFLLKGKLGFVYAPPAGTGARFADVPPGSFALDWIEDLADSGVTAGCDASFYCPDRAVTRAQMAVFLLKAKHGSAYAPPPAAGVFADVPVSSNFAPWIEELAAEGITAGCGGGNYCPDAPNTRAQMAAFIDATFGLSLYGP